MKKLYSNGIGQTLSAKLRIQIVIIASLLCFTASAQTLNFSSYSLQSGTDLTQGAVYRFTNVSSSGNIDALVTITTLYNVQLKSIDSAYTGTSSGFQPMVSSI